MVAPTLQEKLCKASAKCNETDGVIARYDGLSRGSYADRKSILPHVASIQGQYEQLVVHMKDVKDLNKKIAPLFDG